MAAKEKKTVMPSLEDESPSEEEIFSSSASPPSHPQYMLHVDVEANLDQIVYVGRSPLTPTEEQYSPTAPALGTPASMLFQAAAASKAAAAAPAAVAAKANTGFLQPLAKKRKRPQAGADSEDWVNCQCCADPCDDADHPGAPRARIDNCVRCSPCFLCVACRVQIPSEGWVCFACLQPAERRLFSIPDFSWPNAGVGIALCPHAHLTLA